MLEFSLVLSLPSLYSSLFYMFVLFMSIFTHTHSHPFNGPFLGLPRWAGTRKVSQSGFYWSKRQRVAVASAGLYASLHLTPDNHTSTPPLCFLQAGCPSCHLTNSIKALKARPDDHIQVTKPDHKKYKVPLKKRLTCKWQTYDILLRSLTDWWLYVPPDIIQKQGCQESDIWPTRPFFETRSNWQFH